MEEGTSKVCFSSVFGQAFLFLSKGDLDLERFSKRHCSSHLPLNFRLSSQS
jgi:hypothetical protein